MNEGTSVLLGLEDEFTVLQLERIDADTVRVVIEVIDPRAPAPSAGCSPQGSRSGHWFESRTCLPPAKEPICGGSNGAWCAANRRVGQRHSRSSPALCRHGRGSRPGYERRSVRRSRRTTTPSARSPASTRWRGRPRTGRSSHWPTSGCPSRNPPACSASTRPAPGRCAGCSKRPAGHGRTHG